jgi:hypothetical protein
MLGAFRGTEIPLPVFSLTDDYREETTVMIIKTTSLAFAAACLMTVSAMPGAHAQMAMGPQVVTNGPQTDPGDVSPLVSPAERDRKRTL